VFYDLMPSQRSNKKKFIHPSSLAKCLLTHTAHLGTIVCNLPSTLTAEILMTTDTVLCHITYFVFQSDIYIKCVSDACGFPKKKDDLLVLVEQYF
jgi:hypothetical protein